MLINYEFLRLSILSYLDTLKFLHKHMLTDWFKIVH